MDVETAAATGLAGGRTLAAPGTGLPYTPIPPRPQSGANGTGRVDFPEGFLWGAATAAYQVEGAAHTDGREDSIWDVFAKVPGAVVNQEDGAVACDQYHRYPADVALMKDLGIKAYRFSTSWARIQPGGREFNAAGLDYYDRLVDELLAANILPWLTLYHWDLPQGIEDDGGWPARDTAYRFRDYAVATHERLGDRVDVWTTLNEPWCAAFLGYTGGQHAPGRQSREDGLAAAHHLMLGHGLAVQALRERAPEANLGITLNFELQDPVNPDDAADVDAARRLDGAFTRIFADPILRGAYPQDVLDDVERYGLRKHIQDGDLEIISTPFDTLGVNYYHGNAVSATPPTQDRLKGEPELARATSSPFPGGDGAFVHPRGLPTTSQNWEVQPEGLTRLLLRLQEDYTGPRGIAMYVTENGSAYDDEPDADGYVEDTDRLEFIDRHLRAIKDAIDEGADVRGYFGWSLLDNYEWAWGYDKRFGLVRVDYETQERVVKASGRWYGLVATGNSVPELPV